MTVRVFVYGSLRRGMENHDVMAGGRFTSVRRTEAHFQMLDLGRYPAVIDGDTAIVGEVYQISRQHLERLDVFEGVPELYARRETVLDDGLLAWIYLYSGSANGADALSNIPCVPDGDWVTWRLGG